MSCSAITRSWIGFLPIVAVAFLFNGCGQQSEPTAEPEQPSATEQQQAEPSKPAAEQQSTVTDEPETAPPAQEVTASPPEPSTPSSSAPAAERLALGKRLYERHCAGCHGERGDGQGPAADYLWPKPRDFRSGRFRLVSTANGIPTDQDLLGVLERGMPGSAMFPFPNLTGEEKQAVVAYVREIIREGIRERLLRQYQEAGLEPDEDTLEEDLKRLAEPGDPIPRPQQVPEPSEQTLALGKRLYMENCASCHGETGRGDGVQEQFNDDGTPTRPRDFTRGYFKGPGDPATLFVRLRAGMPGSPMPAYPQLSDEQIWAIIHFVRSLVPEGVEERVVHRRAQITVVRVDGDLSSDIPEELWDQAKPVRVVVSPLWWREFVEPDLHVQAIHDGKTLAIRLTWKDPTPNRSAGRLDEFDDKAAVQFFAGDEEPFLGMGAQGARVSVWAWHASWQSDLEGFVDVEKLYPLGYADLYPFSQKVNGRVDQADPFVTARAAGALAADPNRGVAAEAAVAEQFGSLSFLPKPSQAVRAEANWSNGRWTVVLRRALTADNDPLVLKPGQTVSVAFALWDGAARDRDGQKLISIWQELRLEP